VDNWDVGTAIGRERAANFTMEVERVLKVTDATVTIVCVSAASADVASDMAFPTTNGRVTSGACGGRAAAL
jgi:hypothetical protein